MMPKIIIEGVSIDDFLAELKSIMIEDIRIIIRQEIKQAMADKLEPVSKTDACRILGITYPTLIRLLLREGKTKDNVIYNKDVEIWKLKYPKYSRE